MACCTVCSRASASADGAGGSAAATHSAGTDSSSEPKTTPRMTTPVADREPSLLPLYRFGEDVARIRLAASLGRALAAALARGSRLNVNPHPVPSLSG